MRCPICDHPEDINNGVLRRMPNLIKRERICKCCGHQYATFETTEKEMAKAIEEAAKRMIEDGYDGSDT